MNSRGLGLACSLIVGMSQTSLFAAPKVVASGIGFSVTEAEVEKAYLHFVLTQSMTGVNVPRTMAATYQKTILEELIVNKLMAIRATPTDKYAALKEAEKMFKAQQEAYASSKAFKLKVEATGLTIMEFRDKLETETLSRVVAKRELQSKIRPSDGDIRKYYNDNATQWQVPEHAKVAHVLLSKVDLATGRRLNPDERAAKQQTAAKVLGKARTGIEFKTLAKEFSEDLTTKENGGEVQIIRGTAAPQIEAMIFKMQPNQVTLVETNLGWHVILVKERQVAKTLVLSDVREDIHKYLEAERFAKELPKYLADVKRAAGVRRIALK